MVKMTFIQCKNIKKYIGQKVCILATATLTLESEAYLQIENSKNQIVVVFTDTVLPATRDRSVVVYGKVENEFSVVEALVAIVEGDLNSDLYKKFVLLNQS